MTITVRSAAPADAAAWLRMREALWPDGEADHPREVERYFQRRLREPLEVLLAVDERGQAIGFAELSIRPYAEGCETDRVAFLEGWYVEADARRAGVGRALVAAAEEWARRTGCTEFGSDALIDNDTSAAAHTALGFEFVEAIRCFRKAVSGVVTPPIRIATPADAAAIADAHLDSIHAVGPRFYPPAVVEAWASVVTPALYLSAMAGGEVFFVAEESNDRSRLLGFSSHLEQRGVHGISVYVRGAVVRRGLGTTLLRLAEDHAVAHGADALEIQASLPGLAFYTAQGFEAVGPADVVMGGHAIPCVTMRKRYALRGR